MHGPNKRVVDQEDQHGLESFCSGEFGDSVAAKHPNGEDPEVRTDNSDTHGRLND